MNLFIFLKIKLNTSCPLVVASSKITKQMEISIEYTAIELYKLVHSRQSTQYLFSNLFRSVGESVFSLLFIYFNNIYSFF